MVRTVAGKHNLAARWLTAPERSRSGSARTLRKHARSNVMAWRRAVGNRSFWDTAVRGRHATGAATATSKCVPCFGPVKSAAREAQETTAQRQGTDLSADPLPALKWLTAQMGCAPPTAAPARRSAPGPASSDHTARYQAPDYPQWTRGSDTRLRSRNPCWQLTTSPAPLPSHSHRSVDLCR